MTPDHQPAAQPAPGDQHAGHRPTCEEALAELYTFLDGELTDDKRDAIAGHLESCNPCVEIFDFEAELRIVISTRATEAVPESLRLRISQTLTTLTFDAASSVGPSDRPFDAEGSAS